MCVLAVSSVRCDDHKITCHVASLPHIQSQLSDKRAAGSKRQEAKQTGERAPPTEADRSRVDGGIGGAAELLLSAHMRHSKLNRATAAQANDAYLNGVK